MLAGDVGETPRYALRRIEPEQVIARRHQVEIRNLYEFYRHRGLHPVELVLMENEPAAPLFLTPS